MLWLPFLLATLFCQSLAHSWTEQLTLVINGVFTGKNGYPRGYISRSDPGFSDKMMAYLLPPPESGRMRVENTDLLCAPMQRVSNQTVNYPRLQVTPGARGARGGRGGGRGAGPRGRPGE